MGRSYGQTSSPSSQLALLSKAVSMSTFSLFFFQEDVKQ